MFIPGLETVGGFSMCSSPQDLATKGTLTLAIKYSTHPPAHWIHTCVNKIENSHPEITIFNLCLLVIHYVINATLV